MFGDTSFSLKCNSAFLKHVQTFIINTNVSLIEPWHGISNNVVCATRKASDQPAHTHNLIRSFASRLNRTVSVKLLTEHHLELLSLTEGCTGSPEYTLVNMPLLEITCHGSINSDVGNCCSPFLILQTPFSYKYYLDSPMSLGYFIFVCYN